MIAEGIAGCPVIYVGVDPFFKNSKIIRLVLLADKIGPVAGNKRFFQVARLPQVFTEPDNLGFWICSQFV